MQLLQRVTAGFRLLIAAVLWSTTSAAQTSLEVAPPEPSAEAPARLWQREWPSFSWPEGAATVAGGAATLALWLQEPPPEPRWRGGILFDDAVRDAFRLESASGRKRVRALGDWPYRAAPVLPLLVDPLVAWGVHGEGKTALNLTFMGLEAFSYTGLLSFVSTTVSRRQRPDSRQCETGYPNDGDCEVDTESFWSGHTSIAAASAGLVCAHHRYMPIFGHPVADGAACAVASAGALTTGMTRLIADRHYASDVIVGMGVGFGIGYAVPVLLHYSRRNSDVSLRIVPDGIEGVRAVGTF